MPDQSALFGAEASLASGDVDGVFLFILAIAGFFFILTQGLLFYFAIRYRRKKGEEAADTPYITGNQTLEVIWIVIPSLLLVAIFAYGLFVFIKMTTPIPGAAEIQVTASQFQWSFKYQDGRTSVNELRLALGQPVKLIMTSRDVIHSLFIPDYRQKQDLLPGRYTYLWLLPKKTGTFDIYCAEYCGTGHSLMRATLIVMPLVEYDNWVQGERKKLQAGTLSLADRGKALFESSGCLGCHSLDGTPKVGPTLKGVFGRRVQLADGRSVRADEEYLRASIVEPNEDIVKGFQPIMPAYRATLKGDDLAAVIAYLKTLQ
ncbi:MAG: cytochrome c oxidase subunit II [Geobacteraceae bacterium GWC2_58_44]|nr:MAG: cytochrome c oxidase subunit II [Geobacteraceae bacterium GWC2_58_44]HBG05826.1 cytochrome c oxidase subunit II [Geobacter sp.]